jgi:phosphoribosylaminoimidazolecarboxamide formyltransferase/IMP cyclohydrolase
MSYNNYLDLDAACALVREFTEPCAVIVKHNNPCGVAIGADMIGAYLRAREVDPMAAYGSVVALNRAVDTALAEEICSTYVEVIAAPAFDDAARAALRRKENMRVLLLPDAATDLEMRSISGGILVQRTLLYHESWVVRTKRAPDPRETAALSIAWKVCAHTRSNAIILADDLRTLGIGAGQMSRVDAARIAVQKSRFPLAKCAGASDGFLPFPDTLEEVAAAGATALIQPGGSIRDDEVIAAADRLGVAMIFTGVRHFRH